MAGILTAHEIDAWRVDHLSVVHKHALPACHVLLQRREHFTAVGRSELIVHHYGPGGSPANPSIENVIHNVIILYKCTNKNGDFCYARCPIRDMYGLHEAEPP